MAGRRQTRHAERVNTPPFDILYADPPWQFKLRRRTNPAYPPDRPATGRIIPYPTMDTDAICALPVADICAPDCLLFLWATYPMLPDALKVIAAWKFQYKTVGFTWVKRTRSNRGFHFGMGFWSRANPELCLLATRGASPETKRARAEFGDLASPRALPKAGRNTGANCYPVRGSAAGRTVRAREIGRLECLGQ